MILIAMATVVFSGYNLYVAQSQKVMFPDFLLGNLEVLAQGESGNYSCGNYGMWFPYAGVCLL